MTVPTGSFVRVRFAPSPTGHLHIGGLRSALFNWLFARHQGGSFIIRIEDTDIERSKPEYVESILKAFEWVGIASDEPIVYQTQRFALYKSYVDRLVAEGKAYWSDPAREENGKSVVRFKIPENRGLITFVDAIHGPVSIASDQLGGDFVIARSDGTPLYNFVVVVDDTEMRISHVIRGDDHIPNTPKQILLYEALGVPVPCFAHLPMILGPSGAKLSKRDAATSVIEYKALGFLPDALCNYLVRLGWAYGDQEIFSRDEMVKFFTLEGVNKAGAIFDLAKLRWMNGVYLRSCSASVLIDQLQLFDPSFPACLSAWSREQLAGLIDLYKERMVTLVELRDVLLALHDLSLPALPEGVVWDDKTVDLLSCAIDSLKSLVEWSTAGVEQSIKLLCSQKGVPLPAVAKPIRFALTGVMNSPSVFELIYLLGKEESCRRIDTLRLSL